MEKSLSSKSSQGNNAAPLHTINVVLPEKSHPSHSVTSGKGDEHVSTDRSRNPSRSSTKVDNAHPNAEISAVPDPVPNPNPFVQVPYSSAAEHATSLFDSPHTVAGNAPTSVFVYSSAPIVPSILFPLPSQAATHSSTSSPTLASPTSVSAEHPLHTFNNVPSRQTTPHQLPPAAIILLTAGSVLFVATILILTKLWIRPRRRSHPTPSLPILQDAFSHRKLGEESPLFGGKERLSSQPATPWTWTQYQSDVEKSAPSASISKPVAINRPPMRHSRLVDEPHSNVLDTAGSAMQEAVEKPTITNQSSEGHPNKALSRLSTLSGLVYTASVYEPTGQENIGIAVSSGQGDLDFSGSAARDHRKRASARQSMRNFDKRRSTIYGSPEGLAYAMSPIPLGSDGRLDSDGTSRQGRARVKAPYVAGSYLRGSTPKGPDRAHPEVNPFDDAVNGIYALPSMPDSSAGKEVDLTGGPLVIGPIIPDPPISPGFSLYPDDSLSVAEDRSWAVPSVANGKEYAQDSPGVAARRLSSQKTRTREAPSEKSNRTDDRPPRVPSPPVLPSLAQMAMAHTNGQEYGDYRSPTYSLYGLYTGSGP